MSEKSTASFRSRVARNFWTRGEQLRDARLGCPEGLGVELFDVVGEDIHAEHLVARAPGSGPSRGQSADADHRDFALGTRQARGSGNEVGPSSIWCWAMLPTLVSPMPLDITVAGRARALCVA